LTILALLIGYLELTKIVVLEQAFNRNPASKKAASCADRSLCFIIIREVL